MNELTLLEKAWHYRKFVKRVEFILLPMMNDDLTIEGFAPIADDRAEVLILGSMPSAVSLQKQQYYGHRRNAFWPIMMALLSGALEADYQQRKRVLLASHVAVWDVLRSCRRSGSLDAGIDTASMQTNNFTDFYRRHPAIKQVFFNGGLAEQVYKKRVLPHLGAPFAHISYRRLPSTSPAHASMTLQQKCEAWRVILDYLTLS
ncbi:DNA-deoxyinosine glycosylase [Methylomarinum sp. Ch1-1]|uniref:DNA-deoxyinosine glycosylase n=1 Tax=Methylomarinum roseum TaxID=3067653 RepID=A0AAU7NV68_9GAMM|nr:DNA-deoxyinosine glycosylase [Methylomarinum sp. Ch1-1]MDP4523035.1 DNA-deoxyinosine glycosylase [Methylomarinum sp. Ch1-1]